MTVTVVIPVHNGERYLAEAIESVAGEGVHQIVVVDDGSQDGSAEVAQGWGSPVELIRLSQGGIGRALNVGVRQARGELLAFCDADDLWSRQRLTRQIALLSQADLVFGAVQQFVSPELPEQERLALVCPEHPMVGRVLGSCLMRRQTWERVGELAEGYLSGEFLDWFARAQERGLRVADDPQVVLRRRLHRTNQGRVRPQGRQDYARILKQALDRRRGLCAPRPDSLGGELPPGSPDSPENNQ